jgi:transposase
MSASKRLPISRVGAQLANPRFFRDEEHALARAHRKLSREPEKSKRREKRRKAVARVPIRRKSVRAVASPRDAPLGAGL